MRRCVAGWRLRFMAVVAMAPVLLLHTVEIRAQYLAGGVDGARQITNLQEYSNSHGELT
jgi:hypothetical protein